MKVDKNSNEMDLFSLINTTMHDWHVAAKCNNILFGVKLANMYSEWNRNDI